MPFQAYTNSGISTPSNSDGGFTFAPSVNTPQQGIMSKFSSAVGGAAGDVMQGIKGTAQVLTNPLKEGVSALKGIGSGIVNDYKQGGQNIINDVQKTSLSPDYNPQTQQNIGTTALDTVGNIAKTAVSPITQTIGAASNAIAEKASNVPAVQNLANSKAGIATTDTGNTAQQKYSDFATKHPEAAKDLEASFNVAQLVAGDKAEPAASETIQSGLETTGEVGKTGLNAVKSDIEAGVSKGSELAKQAKGKLEDIKSNRLANAEVKAQQDTLDIVKPKLTPTEQAAARAEGRGIAKGKIIKTADIAPNAREVEMGQVANEAGVSSKNTSDVNIQKMKDFQQASAEKVRAGLRQADLEKPLNFDKPQFKGQLGNVMNGVKKPITLVGDSAKIAIKFKSAVMKLADTVKPTREGMLDLRQGLDRLIDEQLPGNIYTKDTPLGQYMRNTRAALNKYIEDKIPDGKLPDGSSFKGELRNQHLLYDAIDNVAEKAPKTGEPSNALVGRVKNFTSKHPVISNALKYGGGALVGEKILKNIGLPLP